MWTISSFTSCNVSRENNQLFKLLEIKSHKTRRFSQWFRWRFQTNFLEKLPLSEIHVTLPETHNLKNLIYYRNGRDIKHVTPSFLGSQEGSQFVDFFHRFINTYNVFHGGNKQIKQGSYFTWHVDNLSGFSGYMFPHFNCYQLLEIPSVCVEQQC